MALVVEYDVGLPSKKLVTRELGEVQAALEAADVGGSIFFPEYVEGEEGTFKETAVRSATTVANARAKDNGTGKKFSARKVAGGIRVFRIE